MRLEDAINQSTTCGAFCQIFDHTVNVQIDTFWGVDSVSVEGYEGVVSTDLIAGQVLTRFESGIQENQEQDASRLADLLKGKIFIPLRDRLMELDRSSCLSSLTYKVRNCTRSRWTPPDLNLTAGYTVLKHSMCIMFLDKSF